MLGQTWDVHKKKKEKEKEHRSPPPLYGHVETVKMRHS